MSDRPVWVTSRSGVAVEKVKRRPAHGSLPRILRKLTPRSQGQPDDRAEHALARHVLASTPSGDLDAVIAAIDQFTHYSAYLINVGDEKGAILDPAVRAVAPMRLLELGAYCGYSALRMARVMPAGARLVSIELGASNAKIATQLIRHAGVADRVSVLVGSLGDGGATLRRLRDEHDFAPLALDFVFLGHSNDDYLPDLQRILDHGWLRAGSVVVADNIDAPDMPAYLSYMRRHEGGLWHTTEHTTHAQNQQELPELVLESTYLAILRA